ncbi:MAG: CRISPR-associated helicase Cas3' [Deltaproteobacteria bacterium]|nr:CRISPR-associated helicase Cas3' [Deltaproteobacteria bacterium]
MNEKDANKNSAPIAHHRASDGEDQKLKDHLFEVGQFARSYAEKIGLASLGELLGLLHDLGKFSTEFQDYLKSAVGLLNPDEDENFVDAAAMRGKIDHSTAGAQWIWQALGNQGAMGNLTAQMLALCLASHHSGLIDILEPSKTAPAMDRFSARMGKSDEKTHLSEVLRILPEPIQTRLETLRKDSEVHQEMAALFKTIAQGKVGHDGKPTPLAQFQLGLVVRFLFSCLIDADRVNTANFENPRAAKMRAQGRYEEWNVLIKRLEDELVKFKIEGEIDQIRQNVSKHCLDGAERDQGIYTLTVPTGGGKTLASLRFALRHAEKHKLERVIYVLPFTTIIDQNARVVRDILEPEGVEPGSVVLEHHSNLTPEKQTWRGKILAENWDAPVVYTTSVQVLEALFDGGTRGARRMHQLARSVIVFDEIQTLPIRTVHMFNNAMAFLTQHCSTTVVLCTATQPLLHQVDPNKGAMPKGEELMPNVKNLFDDLKRVEVVSHTKNGGWSHSDVSELAVAETNRTGSCLVVVNTKKAALEVYNLCRQAVGQNEEGTKVYHLSTHQCPAHRKTILGDMLTHLDPKNKIKVPVLCVSTQLIEAGVDVDFGSVIRFAAGLDSIAQAAGRCNRNGRQPTGRVHVVIPQNENLDQLKDIQVGKEVALRVLKDYEETPESFEGNPIGPKAMEQYYEYYFYKRSGEMEYKVGEHTLGHDDTLLNLLSDNTKVKADYKRNNHGEPPYLLHQSFATAGRVFKAIDAPTTGVIVPYGKDGTTLIGDLFATEDPIRQAPLLRKAQQFTVNLYPYQLKKLPAGALKDIPGESGILTLNASYYHPEFGLSLEPIENRREEVPIG